MEHLRADLPFSCIYVDGDIFSSFFIQRQIDKESNSSHFIIFYFKKNLNKRIKETHCKDFRHFIIFGAFMNYL